MKRLKYILLSSLLILPLSFSTALAATTDTTAPGVPTNVTATVDSSNHIVLNWSPASTTDTTLMGYAIIRNGTLIAVTPATSYTDMTVASSTAYSYGIQAFDTSGNVSAISTLVSVNSSGNTGNMTGVPTGLTATIDSNNRVVLSWTAPTTGTSTVTGYRITRNGTVIANSNTNSFTDSSISPNTTYSYSVQAFDASGNLSTASTSFSITTNSSPVNNTGGDTNVPTMPTGLSATVNSNNQVVLNWTGSSDNVGVTGYRILRNGSLLTTTSGTGTSFTDTGVGANITYSYTIQAMDAAGNISASSNMVSVTTNSGPSNNNGGTGSSNPTVPMNLTVSLDGNNHVVLNWSASSGSNTVTGYQVMRNGALIATTSSTSYTDTAVANGTPYTYSVRAVDSANNVSGVSSVVVITTSGNGNNGYNGEPVYGNNGDGYGNNHDGNWWWNNNGTSSNSTGSDNNGWSNWWNNGSNGDNNQNNQQGQSLDYRYNQNQNNHGSHNWSQDNGGNWGNNNSQGHNRNWSR